MLAKNESGLLVSGMGWDFPISIWDFPPMSVGQVVCEHHVFVPGALP